MWLSVPLWLQTIRHLNGNGRFSIGSDGKGCPAIVDHIEPAADVGKADMTSVFVNVLGIIEFFQHILADGEAIVAHAKGQMPVLLAQRNMDPAGFFARFRIVQTVEQGVFHQRLNDVLGMRFSISSSGMSQ